MRLVFAGSPAAAVPSLQALAAGPHEVVAVLTRDDTPQGRKRVLTPTPVAVAAEELGIRVVKARRVDAAVTEAIRETSADLGVIVAYGALLREPLLSTPRLGWINLHFSLLPRWRGAAPVQRALIAGDAQTGAAVFQLVEALDAGDVYGTLTHELDGSETAGTLLAELAGSGAALLAEVVDELAAGTARPVAQDDSEATVTLAPKLTIDDGLLDPALPANVLRDRFRGVTPEPGAYLMLDGARFKVLDLRLADLASDALPSGRIALDGRRVLLGTGSTPLELVTVQPAGKKAMPAGDWIRGVPDREGLTTDTLDLEPPAAPAGGSIPLPGSAL